MTRLSPPSPRDRVRRPAICSAWRRSVSENEEKYRYSRKSFSGGTVSVICTSEQPAQKARSSGKVSSGSPGCSAVKSALASGGRPSERTGRRSPPPQERHRGADGLDIRRALHGLAPAQRVVEPVRIEQVLELRQAYELSALKILKRQPGAVDGFKELLRAERRAPLRAEVREMARQFAEVNAVAARVGAAFGCVLHLAARPG